MKQTAGLSALMEQYPHNSPNWSLVDAFDAAANGMENPESFALMETITEPGLQSWKSLVHSIKALYKDDIPACRAALARIDDDSAPGKLKGLFLRWMGRGRSSAPDGAGEHSGSTTARNGAEMPALNAAVMNLYRQLILTPHPLSLAAEQAEEALRQGLEEQFAVLAGRVMRDLREQRSCDGPLLALRYARYCLALLEEAGANGANFLALVTRILGEADGYCVLGFALLDKGEKAAAADALKRALNAGDGGFLDAAMSAVIGETLSLLEDRRERVKPPEIRTRGKKRNAPAGLAAGAQPDLFGDLYG
ncbi:hypothetical protein AGMMS50267_07430 [Spirochaetia bacterium]|nr:hypothetical protein AGMMS50267_07430 [Spirochaetia bacterium]